MILMPREQVAKKKAYSLSLTLKPYFAHASKDSSSSQGLLVQNQPSLSSCVASLSIYMPSTLCSKMETTSVFIKKNKKRRREAYLVGKEYENL